MMNRKLHQQALCLLSLATLAGAAMSAPPEEYRVHRIDEMLGLNGLASTYAINENGDAVGAELLNNGYVPFVYTYEHGAMYLPLFDPHPEARAVAVSDRDANGDIIIVGSAGNARFEPTVALTTAVYWRYSTVSGQVVEQVDIGVLPGWDKSEGVEVNNNGKIIAFNRDLGFTPPPEPMVYDIHTGTRTSITFPVIPVDINNLDQIAGGTYIGDLLGNATDIGIPPTAAGAEIVALTDSGSVAATITMPYTDGNGRFVNGAARYTGAWQILWNNSAFDYAAGINEGGDVVGELGFGGSIDPVIFYDDVNTVYDLTSLITPPDAVFLEAVSDINTNGQVATSLPAAVLTPLGRMIIPGDVNGDAEVMPDDLCAWLDNPIDLDGDGDADADDELWLIDRLASLGYTIDDCNANGRPDTCDILDGISTDCNENGIPDECEADCDADGIPDDCESDCNDNGVPDDCDIAGGFSDDCNNNGIPDECDGSDTVEGRVDYNPPQPLFENSTFIDSVLISDAGTVADVDFTIDVDFRIGQITVKLHHAGVSATLINQPGLPDFPPYGFSNLGYRITLDDEGAGPDIETVGAECCDFDPIVSPPSYKPSEPLSVFDGLPRDGEWTLEFIGGFPQHFDPKLLSWSVIVTDEAVDPGVCCEADLTGDGVADRNDFFAYLDLFAAGDPAADITGNGTIDADDFFAYLDLFAQGC